MNWNGSGGVGSPIDIDVALVHVNQSADTNLPLFTCTVSKPNPTDSVGDWVFLPLTISPVELDVGDQILVSLRTRSSHSDRWNNLEDKLKIIALPGTNDAPVVINSPENITIGQGSNAMFQVLAVGPEPLSFQWLFNGTNILGATGTNCTVTDAQTNHTGNYSVMVSNAFGLVRSDVAVLTVVPPPIITAQPQSQSWPLGYPVTFSVTAESLTPLTYQWLKDGSNLAGATSASYSIASIQPNNAGNYACLVSNLAGVVLSADITLGIREALFNNPEDFENGKGDWLVDSGVWEVGVPTSGPGVAFAGSNCLATVLGGNYTDGRTSRVSSPAFTVPSENPRLRFWHWWSFHTGSDYGQVQVSTNAGGTWEALSPQFKDNSSGIWTRPSYDLGAYAGQELRVGFYFYAYDNYSGDDVSAGWYVDEVVIEDGPLDDSLAGDLADGFEDAASPDSWASDLGVWEVGVPTSGPGVAFAGSNCLATVLGGNYTDGRTSRVSSPAFTVPSENPRLRFWHWWSFHTGSDYGQVQVSVDGGVTWQGLSPKFYLRAPGFGPVRVTT